MNIFQIETFLSIVHTGSISRAAELMYLTQPTVSHRLKSLEDELNFCLLNRKKGSRTIELTKEGEQFVSIAARWMELWYDTQLLAAGKNKLPLNLCSVESLSFDILTPLCARIAPADQEPLFDLKVLICKDEEVYHRVETGQADIGLCFLVTPSDDLLAEPLFYEKLTIVKRRPDFSEVRTAWHPDELDPAFELVLDCSPTYGEWHECWWRPDAAPYAKLESAAELPEHLKQANLWAVVPMSTAKLLEQHHPIKVYEILDPPQDRTCFCLMHRQPREGHVRSIQLFVSYLQNYVKSLYFLSK